MTNSRKAVARNRLTMADLVRGRRPSEILGLASPSRPAPPLEESRESTSLDPFEDRQPSNDLFRRAVAITDEVLRSVRSRTSFPVTVLEAPLQALVESVQTSDVLLLPFFNPGGGSADPAEKAVNACVLSMKIGTQLNYAHDSSLELGLAALLYQIGVGRTSKDDAQLVHGLRTRHAGAAAVLVQLRERTHGAGDAAHVEPTEIGEHAHIVALAGIIESLVRRGPVRSGLGHAEVIKEILKRERGTYPHKILTALIRILATLPVGSLVRLNTGEICRVAAKKDGFPLRPIVVVLVRQRKRVAERQVIDLSQHPFLHIHGFVTEEMLDREAEPGAP
jgi:hypothetical protein